MKYFLILLIGLFFLNSCNETNKQPLPSEPTCFELTPIDTVEYMKGVVKVVDTLVYISNYIDETTDLKYFPCAINPIYVKDGFPVEYSGLLKKRDKDTKSYIQLTAIQPIVNETVFTNYKGLIRFRDSLTISPDDKNGIIKSWKVENYKLKILLAYSGCTRGRTNYISLYKTARIGGKTYNYGLITSPYEACSNIFTLWYEFDASAYKDNVLELFDGVKTYQIAVPK